MSVDESECAGTTAADGENIKCSLLEKIEHQENLEAAVSDDEEPKVDPIDDIIDYLVRCARGAFPCARVGEREPSTAHNTALAHDIYRRSIGDFLMRFGKHLAYTHLDYFEAAASAGEQEQVQRQIEELRRYLSVEGKRKRAKNRRYQALQKLRDESDYFSEKEMMFRNPLLYEQLVGQFLTDEEIAQRDNVDSESLTFVNMILDTVDRNVMRQTRNEQELSEKMETTELSDNSDKHSASKSDQPEPAAEPTSHIHWGEFENESNVKDKPRWGDFEKPDPTPKFEPDVRQQSMISAPERDLLRREFLHEMYGSFLEGRDTDFDYDSVDDNEQFDDLQTVDRDKEEAYFDSEPAENENLEQTMRLAHEYRRKSSNGSAGEDELDVFMARLNNRQGLSNLLH